MTPGRGGGPTGTWTPFGCWGQVRPGLRKDRGAWPGTQMSLECPGHESPLPAVPGRGRGGGQTGEGWGRGPRIRECAASSRWFWALLTPAVAWNADPPFLLALLDFQPPRNHQSRTLTTETPRKPARSWNLRGAVGLEDVQPSWAGGPTPPSGSWTKGTRVGPRKEAASGTR